MFIWDAILAPVRSMVGKAMVTPILTASGPLSMSSPMPWESWICMTLIIRRMDKPITLKNGM